MTFIVSLSSLSTACALVSFDQIAVEILFLAEIRPAGWPTWSYGKMVTARTRPKGFEPKGRNIGRTQLPYKACTF
jgi:hypothetical protein